ncbi:hypothetical protein Tco_0577323, partial [Tanacetum coccineum]
MASMLQRQRSLPVSHQPSPTDSLSAATAGMR